MSKQKDKTSSTILIITYDFYPDTSPNTYRWHNILKIWEKRGHQIHVISAHKPEFLKSEIVDGIRIHRTGRSWLEMLKSKIPKHVELKNEKDSLSKSELMKESLIKKIYNSTFKRIYFPDFAFLWYFPAAKLAVDIIIEHKIDTVITVSWPFTDHVIGNKIKNKFNNINWIADTVDPFCLSKTVNNQFLFSKFNYKFENKILKKADHVVVITEKIKNAYTSAFPELRKKITVNHNLYIPQGLSARTEISKISAIQLVFVGTLSEKNRSPANLLELFEKLLKIKKSNLELHFYGPYEDCQEVFLNFKEYINLNIFIHGAISKAEANEVLVNADILVNIGNNNPYQEPSKIIEYISLKKPILNVCSIQDDSVIPLLESYPLKFNVLPNHYDVNAVYDFLNERATIDVILVDNLISNYMLEEVEARYYDLL
jgi:hypothetical protein